MKIIPYLQLARPANIVTSVSDILAGIAIASIGTMELSGLPWQGYSLLILSTIGLYGGGIVFNDVADAELDSVERPERPIPSGRVSSKNALKLTVVLFAIGIVSAFSFDIRSGILALFITFFSVIYDLYGKHHSIMGPVNMGLCRGLNLLLGISILPDTLNGWYGIALIPVVYISAITMISRGEVHGSSKKPLLAAAGMYIIVHLAQGITAYLYENLWIASPFIFLHIFLLFKPLLKAIKTPSGPLIGKSVKAGVLSLIIMNAAWAGVAGSITLALIIASLLPVSMFLGKKFAVT